jgi:hypothetical protein
MFGTDVRHRRLKAWFAIAATVVLIPCLFAAQAEALKTRRVISSFPVPGGTSAPAGLAVNQETGRVYLADNGNHRVDIFGANGVVNPSAPKLVGLPVGLNPIAVTVDNSSEPSHGTIWVAGVQSSAAETDNQFVQQFNAAGTATAVAISAASLPADGTAQSGGLPPVVNPSPNHISGQGLAVTAAGNLLVYTLISKLEFVGGVEQIVEITWAIDEFNSAGVFIRQIGKEALGGLKPLATTNGALSVDSNGRIYVPTSTGLLPLNADGECEASCQPVINVEPHGLATTPGDNVLLTRPTSGEQGVLVEVSPGGSVLAEASDEAIQQIGAVALNTETDTAYVANHLVLGASTVEVFGPTITLPDPVTGAATEVTGATATLNGTIGAAGGGPATCTFQYVTEEQFSSSRFAQAENALCEPGGPFVGESVSLVAAHLPELNGGTTYHYRLVGENAEGVNRGVVKTFTTLGPVVSGEAVSNIGERTADLHASVDPSGEETSFSFQYVDAVHFLAEEWASALEAPVPAGEIGAGAPPTPISESISNLLPGVEYHFRLVAKSAGGIESVGPDRTFKTFAEATALPDGRAYEQVSPTAKNGASIQGETNAVRAAATGSAITFFNNAGLPGGEGQQNFPLSLALRADGGWITRGLLPPGATGPAGRVLGWDDNLTSVYLENKQPGGPPTLFQRNVGNWSVSEIESAGKAKGEYAFAAQANNGSAVLFETVTASLAPGAATGKRNVYLRNGVTGETVLAGALNPKVNGEAPKAPKGGALAGPYDWFDTGETAGVIGGAQTYDTVGEHTLSDDARSVIFTDVEAGQVYLRRNPLEAQSAMAGGVCTEAQAACTVQVSAPNPGVVDPLGSKPAAFVGATADGSSIFILSSGKLTTDATTGPEDQGSDLYVYRSDSGALRDLTVDAADPNGAEVQGVLGISEDGSRAYIAANGVLAPGATRGDCQVGALTGECNIYELDGTTATFVARVQPRLSGENATTDLMNWAPTTVVPPAQSAQLEQATGRVSKDGRVLLFRSAAQITTYDNHGRLELYRYATGSDVQCVSCNPTGDKPSGSASLQGIPGNDAQLSQAFFTATRNLSSDGNRVFFTSPDQLVARDHNGVDDAYEWEAPDATNPDDTCHSTSQNGGCLYLLSSGGPNPGYFGDASENGNDVYIFTAEPLVRQDQDELVDVYDARVGGGIASQNAEPPPPCQGESCPSPPLGEPPQAPVGSQGVSAGNVKPKTCKKTGKKAKHGKKAPKGCKPPKSKKKPKTKHHQKSGKHGARAQAAQGPRGQVEGGGR